MDINFSRKKLYIYVFIASFFVFGLSGTFAFMQASANKNSGLTGNIGNVGLTLNVSKVTDVNAISPNSFTSSTLGTAINSSCVVNGEKVCDIFRVSIKANASIKLDGTLKVEPDIGASLPNLRWSLLGNSTTTTVTYSSSNYNPVLINNVSNICSGFTINTSYRYFYVAVWVDDSSAGGDNGNYKGTVTFMATGSTNGKVTATFS